jgi:hypothetical protein
VADERPLPETLLDCLLYAPLGAAVVAAEELSRLAERGRERFEQRIGVASSVGRFAVQGTVSRLKAPGAASRRPVEVPPQPVSDAPAPMAGKTPERVTKVQSTKPPIAARPARSRPAATRGSPEASRLSADGSGEELPIPAYGTLAASQVVERLASLTPGELESVRRHESATRRRRTVLHRIAQLSAERGSVTA